MVWYVSKCRNYHGSRDSDSYIPNDSRFLLSIEPGDIILEDKEFPRIRTEWYLGRQCLPFCTMGALPKKNL